MMNECQLDRKPRSLSRESCVYNVPLSLLMYHPSNEEIFNEANKHHIAS